ncbi:aminopeptidase P family protein [Acuticoccus sp. MNP-M23]|uniref:aminopeptidase P family protein n=1 Tax=Acuticoccus sp. MNP-M23 TaxID=3072793 RepID=UPI002814AE9C|nr:aminopeptidase P family protein [Acuticoccus sp. MNP-M23]WMS41003.1 aminopeptidase P family protein [Acuticoccus sp. MNP-M23]
MAFQTFDSPRADPAEIRKRIAALRATFGAHGVDGVIVPHEDAYNSEYLPPSEERLAWITGFTGSAGRAIVLKDKALLATDGRYTLQAETQVPDDVFTIVSTEEAARAWLTENLAGVTLGFDPSLHARDGLKRLDDTVPTLTRTPLSPHPVDTVWTNRPAMVPGAVRAHPAALAGRTPAEKLASLREKMETDALLIAESDAVSWLLNWRGADVAHTPLVLSRAFVPKDGPVTVFVDPAKVPDELAAALDGVAVIEPEANYPDALTRLSEGLTVGADLNAASEAALLAIEKSGTLKGGADPSVALKAEKNEAEIAGMRAAHQRDGVAMVRFLAWFDAHAAGATEIDLVEALEGFRREAGARDISFDTISGAGPNGAIVHYRVDRESNRTIVAGDPVLVDSGGQYDDGTTDITRTMVAGAPTDEFRTAFTLVLKGHIALARQRFPEGASGAELDTLARFALWNAGLDYAHGTGHGVGAALAVHEGPAGISKRSRVPLKPGMVISNEPGVYPGPFGIRIENLVLVKGATVPPGGTKPMLAFETITLVPIDTRLVAPHLLSAAEIGWLDTYHARVHGALVGDLDAAGRAWLEERCRPLVG